MTNFSKGVDQRIGWREITPESVYVGRRDFLRLAGMGAASVAAYGLIGCERRSQSSSRPATRLLSSPATRNPRYILDRPLTDEKVAATYNNYYEFTADKEEVAQTAASFRTSPWTVEIAGLVAKPRRWDLAELVKAMSLEERLYRHRCVEAWAMAVPWIGFPMAALIKRVEPLSAARFVRMVSFLRPEEAIGQRQQRWYPWPYYEGLTMAEAMNELTLLATGIYGHDLPPQHGAPLRLVTPWKYGFKSIKAITRIEFTADKPPNFWNTVAPAEYDFEANVNPSKPHPRWSQAHERMIGTNERRATVIYNGYGAEVAALYKS